MDEINRRALIGAAGATMALAACGESKDGSATTMPATQDPSNRRGVSLHWGEDPHKDAPAKKPAGGFAPGFACIVYIKFDDGKKTIVRHGYLDISKRNGETEAEYAARQKKELDELWAAAAKGNWKASTVGHKNKQINFENFNFGQQMRIYVLVDNDNVRFDDRKSTDGKYANLVRFTQFRTTKDMTNFDPEEAAENHAFFGADLVDIALGGKTRKALKLDNWYVGPEAAEIKADDPSTHQYYAMNFQLLWEAADSDNTTKITRIPIVIDPDGGNMGGQP